MDFERLDAGDTSIVFDVRGSGSVAYLGPRLDPEGTRALGPLLARERRGSTADDDLGAPLIAASGMGFLGAPAIVASRPVDLRVRDVIRQDTGLTIHLHDPTCGLVVSQHWESLGRLFRVATVLENEGETPVEISWLAALTLPLPAWVRDRIGFAGRWAGEFQIERAGIATGVHEMSSRGGRSGFDNPGFAIVGARDLGDLSGWAIGAHLAWSGNVRQLVERTGFGLTQFQMGERLDGGEVTLRRGDSYNAPPALLCFTTHGLDGLRQAFHRHARTLETATTSARRVHFNTWEAAYFDFDGARLSALADAAADLGAERFVLDDGWFVGRGDATAGLGDWEVDPQRFPEGLETLIAHVHARGMDFGLWVEPEMVNPDSALFRAQPDWVLGAGGPLPSQRRQLVLDLSQTAVRDHLFTRLDALLARYEIAYLKWDHNRELFPATSGGKASARAQTLGLYELMDCLRRAHPEVEIEGCASGGGRIDSGMMARTHRFWVSDNTDAIERLRLQSALSLFVPLSRIGAHVGASPNPTTGRRLAMEFRARISMFGHMGVEADPRVMSDKDRETLAAHIGLYKRFRPLLHDGVFHAYAGDDPDVQIWLSVAPDGREALGLAARATQAAGAISAQLRLHGLDDDRTYRVAPLRPWPEPAWRSLADAHVWREGVVASGRVLRTAGVRWPLVHPETAWLFYVSPP